GLGFVKFKQLQTAIAQGASFAPPPSAVSTIVARKESWPSTLNIIGTAQAIQGVTVSADLPGTVYKINFESGQAVHAGDVLVELDTRQERAQLAAGAAIVPLQALNPIYVNFGVPQQSAPQVRGGRALHVTSEDLPGILFNGRVTAVDSVVSEATRNIQVQATVPNPQGKLRPGMYVQVQVILGESRSVITLPASAINYAPYGDSAF